MCLPADPGQWKYKENGRTHGFAPTDPWGYCAMVQNRDYYIRGIHEKGWKPFEKKLWQRNYYEHIIRNDTDLNSIREYIATNPLKWEFDRENPEYRIISL